MLNLNIYLKVKKPRMLSVIICYYDNYLAFLLKMVYGIIYLY